VIALAAQLAGETRIHGSSFGLQHPGLMPSRLSARVTAAAVRYRLKGLT
jgi:hypothetical protein